MVAHRRRLRFRHDGEELNGLIGQVLARVPLCWDPFRAAGRAVKLGALSVRVRVAQVNVRQPDDKSRSYIVHRGLLVRAHSYPQHDKGIVLDLDLDLRRSGWRLLCVGADIEAAVSETAIARQRNKRCMMQPSWLLISR